MSVDAYVVVRQAGRARRRYAPAAGLDAINGATGASSDRPLPRAAGVAHSSRGCMVNKGKDSRPRCAIYGDV